MAQRTPDDKISLEIAKLQQPLAGRRKLSWLLFLGVLLATLVLPFLAAVQPSWVSGLSALFGVKAEPVSRVAGSPRDVPHAAWGGAAPAPVAAQARPTLAALDTMWNPGPLAASHQTWANDCRACHSESFSRVKDADCLVCHNNITDHVDRKIVKVSELTEVRCATCHRDHKGAFGLAEQNKRYTATNCASCHADIKKSFDKTQTANVSDFAREHPEFRVQIATDKPGVFNRVRLDQKPVEVSKLKFPHDAHLVAAGVNGPKGKQKMVCADCHVADEAGVNFKTVNMKDHCQSCHTLGFEPAVPGRQVPHGSVAEVLNTLREFYGFVAMSGVPVDRPQDATPLFRVRPGKEEREASFVRGAGDARSRAAAAATELFEKTGCVVCHEVTRINAPGEGSGRDLPQWKIAPVATQHAWMPKAKFDHKAHATAQCVDCHKAPDSKKSAEVLMPAIDSCRDCHAGAKPVAGKVQSDCGLCHGFHLPAHEGGHSAQTSKPSPIKTGLIKNTPTTP